MSNPNVKTREFSIIVQIEENKKVFTRRKRIVISQALLNDPELLNQYHLMNIAPMLRELNNEIEGAPNP